MRDDSAYFRYIIAEDEPIIRENLIKKIEKTGLPFKLVGEAEDGGAALNLADKFNPHLLITDIRMPVLSGIDLIEKLYYSRPGIKVVVISGYDDFTYTKAALKFGVLDYILKPVNMGELTDILSRILVKLQEDVDGFKEGKLLYPEHSAHETLARDVSEYMRNHYNGGITVESLAGLFRVNTSYLSRIFTRHIGLSPMKYLTHLRLSEAKKLLVDYPDLEIKEIAFLVGYSDQCYFSRIFRKSEGLSPQEYRTEHEGS